MNNILNEKSNVEKVPFVLKVGFCIMFVLFLFSLLCITYKKEYKLKYDENSTLNYKVYLKDNEFYTEKYLGMDNAYIASLVDFIDVNIGTREIRCQGCLDVLYDMIEAGIVEKVERDV